MKLCTKNCLLCLYHLNCVPGNFSCVIVQADDFCFEGFRRLSILSEPNSHIFFEDDFENGSIVRLCYEYEPFFRLIMISSNWSNLSYFVCCSRGLVFTLNWDDFLKQISNKYIFPSIMYLLKEVLAKMNRNDAVNQFKNLFLFSSQSYSKKLSRFLWFYFILSICVKNKLANNIAFLQHVFLFWKSNIFGSIALMWMCVFFSVFK